MYRRLCITVIPWNKNVTELTKVATTRAWRMQSSFVQTLFYDYIPLCVYVSNK